MNLTNTLLSLTLTLLVTTPALAVNVVQDSQIAINPVVRQYPVTAIGTGSTPANFSVSNLTGTAMNISGVTLAGVNPTEFDIINNGCSGSLAGNTSCTITVAFKPASQGTKSALLQIASSSTDTPTLAAYLTNSAATIVEAKQRMPATLAAVSIPDTMTATTPYDLTWTIEGYDDSYKSYAVMFDCTGIVDGSCGNSYGDTTRFAESALLDPATTSSGQWTYGGLTTKRFTYNWTFNPATRNGGAPFAAAPGTDVVVRFYLKSDVDAARGSSGVSLLIPGNLSASYYDSTGRRISKKIAAP